jgi:hypothetical protein
MEIGITLTVPRVWPGGKGGYKGGSRSDGPVDCTYCIDSIGIEYLATTGQSIPATGILVW